MGWGASVLSFAPVVAADNLVEGLFCGSGCSSGRAGVAKSDSGGALALVAALLIVEVERGW